MMDLTREELDLCRQWFNAVVDIAPEYLDKDDYRLAIRLYETLGHFIPEDLRRKSRDPV